MKKPTQRAGKITGSMVGLPKQGWTAGRKGIGRTALQTKGPAGGKGAGASHWFFKVLGAAYLFAVVWTSLAYAVESRGAAGGSIAASVTSRARARVSTVAAALRDGSRALDVREYVQGAAEAAGVNPSAAEWIVSHESGHRPQATGDGGDSRGLWQINRVYHPEVSDRCAYDVQCSTGWSLRRIREGNINEWSTWKYRRRLLARGVAAP